MPIKRITAEGETVDESSVIKDPSSRILRPSENVERATWRCHGVNAIAAELGSLLAANRVIEIRKPSGVRHASDSGLQGKAVQSESASRYFRQNTRDSFQALRRLRKIRQ